MFPVNSIIMGIVFQKSARIKNKHYTCSRVNFWSLILCHFHGQIVIYFSEQGSFTQRTSLRIISNVPKLTALYRIRAILFDRRLLYANRKGWGKTMQMPMLCLSLFCCLLIFFKINLFEKFFQKYHLNVKQIGSRSGLTLCQALSGSKLFAKVISRSH